MTEQDVKRLSQALLTIQRQLLNPNDDEDRRESLQFYLELGHELQEKGSARLDYAQTVITNSKFMEAFTTNQALLFIPLVRMVNTYFQNHQSLPKILLYKDPDVLDKFLTSILSKSYNMETPEDFNQSCHFIYLLVEHGGNKMLTFITKNHIKAKEFIIGSEHHEEIAKKIEQEMDRLHHLEILDQAAIVIQCHIRGFLQKSRWRKIAKGMKQLQLLHRKRLKVKDRQIEKELLKSEKVFESQYQALVDRRRKAEREMKDLINRTQTVHLASEGFDQEDDEEFELPVLGPKIEVTDDLLDAKDERVRAATIIQAGIRRYLVKKRRKGVSFLRSVKPLSSTWTRDKVRQYQEEIDLWQQENKVPNLTPNEFQELHRKAQFQYARFAQSLGRRRVQEERVRATLAQTQAIIATLEAAPKLQDYTTDQWVKFHSLPLHIATKARMDHKKDMEQLMLPKWQKLMLN